MLNAILQDSIITFLLFDLQFLHINLHSIKASSITDGIQFSFCFKPQALKQYCLGMLFLAKVRILNKNLLYSLYNKNLVFVIQTSSLSATICMVSSLNLTILIIHKQLTYKVSPESYLGNIVITQDVQVSHQGR